MNERWNLDAIYRGFDDPQYIADVKKLEETIGVFGELTKNLSETEDVKKTLCQGIQLQEKISELIDRLLNFGYLRQSADAKDGEAGSQVGQLVALCSGIAAPQAAFESWASSLPDLMEIVAHTMPEYGFLFQNMVENSCHLLPGLGEEIMAKMAISGSGAWSDLHTYITSTVPVTYRGEKTTLSAIRNLAYDPDPQVRRDAFAAEMACYERIEAPAAFALNAIKLETLTDCQLRGYGSPLERTLKESHLSRKTLDAMFAAIDEYLPHFRRYLKAKAKMLGSEKGLAWCDLFAPVGKSSAKLTAEDAKAYLTGIFSGFDRELRDMVTRAFDEAWIDFYPREGKSGGAFCAGIQSIGQSRILANFDGAFTDVITLAHELGHAFHNQCIQKEKPLNQEYSLPLAETASTFNECVVMATAIRDAADDQEKLALIESQLQDATQIICDIYSRYLFETAVFQNRSEEFMHADKLCQMMTDAQKQSYGDGLDENRMHPYMWVCKGHYYGPTFYNFPYAFGGLFARGLYAQYEKEGAAFVPKYKKLLKTTTAACGEDVAKVADIDLTDQAFWRGGLDTIVSQIDLFCRIAEEV